MNDRSHMPEKLRRRVLVEAGHRCAIPTCRYVDVDVHHIIPYADCQKHEYENLIALCPNCHRRADRGDIDRKSLRLYKANLRFTHDKFSQLEVDILLLLGRSAPGSAINWPPFNDILINRLIDAAFVDLQQFGGRVMISGMQASPNQLTLTPAGRKYVEDLGLRAL